MKKLFFSAAAVLAVVGSAMAFSASPSDILFCNDGNITHGCKVETPFVSLTDHQLGSVQQRCAAASTTSLCPIVTVYTTN
ncbi:hypothetical protein [Chitinophaga sp. Ak27]|uniref:hypothetical protein n=1 Tax=Chitinophaga sp. Ak27 TaxID=2726116 RepID=UPI00145E5D57|nr:hypothetical protein [Chitinophaga sp. Ak27]NLU94870.1 hypothetical protein [Chitinophaga sp. Ak27]